jgi:hypothetical protein
MGSMTFETDTQTAQLPGDRYMTLVERGGSARSFRVESARKQDVLPIGEVWRVIAPASKSIPASLRDIAASSNAALRRIAFAPLA